MRRSIGAVSSAVVIAGALQASGGAFDAREPFQEKVAGTAVRAGHAPPESVSLIATRTVCRIGHGAPVGLRASTDGASAMLLFLKCDEIDSTEKYTKIEEH
jgi:hypothetical protein